MVELGSFTAGVELQEGVSGHSSASCGGHDCSSVVGSVTGHQPSGHLFCWLSTHTCAGRGTGAGGKGPVEMGAPPVWIQAPLGWSFPLGGSQSLRGKLGGVSNVPSPSLDDSGASLAPLGKWRVPPAELTF